MLELYEVAGEICIGVVGVGGFFFIVLILEGMVAYGCLLLNGVSKKEEKIAI